MQHPPSNPSTPNIKIDLSSSFEIPPVYQMTEYTIFKQLTKDDTVPDDYSKWYSTIEKHDVKCTTFGKLQLAEPTGDLSVFRATVPRNRGHIAWIRGFIFHKRSFPTPAIRWIELTVGSTTIQRIPYSLLADLESVSDTADKIRVKFDMNMIMNHLPLDQDVGIVVHADGIQNVEAVLEYGYLSYYSHIRYTDSVKKYHPLECFQTQETVKRAGIPGDADADTIHTCESSFFGPTKGLFIESKIGPKNITGLRIIVDGEIFIDYDYDLISYISSSTMPHHQYIPLLKATDTWSLFSYKSSTFSDCINFANANSVQIEVHTKLAADTIRIHSLCGNILRTTKDESEVLLYSLKINST
jgi:hypothetical protein